MLSFTALVEDVQLHVVKPVCCKFPYLTVEVTALVLYVGMVKNYHGEKKGLEFCTLSHESWVDEFARNQRLQGGESILWNAAEEKGNLKWKEGGRWVYYTHT